MKWANSIAQSELLLHGYSNFRSLTSACRSCLGIEIESCPYQSHHWMLVEGTCTLPRFGYSIYLNHIILSVLNNPLKINTNKTSNISIYFLPPQNREWTYWYHYWWIWNFFWWSQVATISLFMSFFPSDKTTAGFFIAKPSLPINYMVWNNIQILPSCCKRTLPSMPPFSPGKKKKNLIPFDMEGTSGGL